MKALNKQKRPYLTFRIFSSLTYLCYLSTGPQILADQVHNPSTSTTYVGGAGYVCMPATLILAPYGPDYLVSTYALDMKNAL